MANKFYIKCLETLNETMADAEKEYALQKSIGDITLRSTSILTGYKGQARGIIYVLSKMDMPQINTQYLYSTYAYKIDEMIWNVITEK